MISHNKEKTNLDPQQSRLKSKLKKKKAFLQNKPIKKVETVIKRDLDAPKEKKGQTPCVCFLLLPSLPPLIEKPPPFHLITVYKN